MVKKFCGRLLRGLRQIDLAFVQALDQFVGGDVDQHHVVGALEHPVRHGLAHATPVTRLTTSARLSTCWTLSAVHTSRPASSNSSTSCQRLGWRLSGALVWASSSTTIRVGRALERRVDVEFLQLPPAIVDFFARQDFQAFEQSGCFGASVGLDEADDDIDALGLQRARAQQHRKSLPDAGSGAEEDL